jgi:hypothetical protein
MRHPVPFVFLLTATVFAQTGQQGPRPGWPCIPGRAVDPAYVDASESTGGQLFLFQKGEVAQASLVMNASHTHPATVLRAVGQSSGTREFEFPVDTSIQSLLVLASLQCRNAIAVFRPAGTEMTAANSARNMDLQAGRILQIDSPESGKWRVRLTGTGLFVLSVLAKTAVQLTAVTLKEPHLGVPQTSEAHLAGEVSGVKFALTGPTPDELGVLESEQTAEGAYRMTVTPRAERFRVVATGTDASGWPVMRTWPVLFRAGVSGGK